MRFRPGSRHASLASVALHGTALAVAFVLFRHAGSSVRPLRLPGTPAGKHLLLSYTTGAPQATAASGAVRTAAPRRAARPFEALQSAAVPLPPAPLVPAAEAGSGNSGDSALGDDNVRIALPQVHPRPQPDLSSLPHGAAGDVVVDVTIDDTGKVTETHLVKGLGTSIDSTVMQALRTWRFTPASRNGTNIASEQEVLIHYERG